MSKVWWIAVLLVVVLSADSAAAANLYSPTPLQSGWTQISPGGDTICGHGLPYSFFYHDGPGSNLMIDFQGGGMCWNGQTCSPTKDTTFDDWVDPNNSSDNPGMGAAGITSTTNPDNPFVDYDMLYVAYCTGDMHTGSKVQGYTYNNTYFDVKHQGAVNAAAALNWVYANDPAPASVFVSGCSAGAVGAAYWTADIARHYRGTRVTLFSDSGGGWRGIPAATWNLWGTNYQGVTGGSLSIQRFFTGAARAGAHVAELNTIGDETQTFFTQVGFSGAPYVDALRANLRDIAASARGFRYFTGDGTMHCITARGDFYTYSSNAVRIRDWVANLAQGQPVNTIICTSCAEPK